MPALLRSVERKINNDWYVCAMSELNTGDVFRLREPSGELTNNTTWVAAGEPNLTTHNGEGIWGIMAKPEGENNGR